MKSKVPQQITEYIIEKGAAKAKDLAHVVGISPQALHRHLKKMVQSGELIKRGSAPIVFYELPEEPKVAQIQFPTLSPKVGKTIEEKYFYVSPSGKVMTGTEAFQAWAAAIGQESAFHSLAAAFHKQRLELDRKFNNDLIDATTKVSTTFESMNLNEVVYQDFWSIPQFGKTRLGHLVTLGKSGQNLDSIKILAKEAEPIIRRYIKARRIDAVAYAPHSIPRKLVFLKTYSELLNLSLPTIKFGKALTDGIVVAQKSLSKLPERIKNAKETIFVMQADVAYKRVLIIDDALGSGATMNEMAKKLRDKQVTDVFGFAIVGSMKGFEVIPDV